MDIIFMVAALEKKKATLAFAVAVKKDRDPVTAMCKYVHAGVIQLTGFANKEMALLEAEVVKILQKLVASVARVEQILFEVHCVLGFAKKAIKLPERVFTVDTAAPHKVLKDGKSIATRSKRRRLKIRPMWNKRA